VQFTSALSYRGTLAAQWTQQALFSSEQIFAGGAGTVRGFAESTLAGDRGAFMRHEMIYTRLPPVVERIRMEPFFFFDAADVQLIADGKWRSIAGTGIGVRAAGQNANLELVLAKPVLYPETIADTGWRIHATFNLTM
jgi:hemolysin activation/secretion protein